MFDGKMKALTFSYDDGVLQDERLIGIFRKYGLKATFNLNSELLGKQGKLQIADKEIDHTKIAAEKVRTLYEGFEVAAHTLTHPNLTKLEDGEVIRQAEEDRRKLSALTGYEVRGMAYPGGGINHDDRVAELIRNHTSIKYARTITSTYSFEMQKNLYCFDPTVHHTEWTKLEELKRAFLDLKPERPSVFYVWGHSYEFDIGNGWELFEDFCRDISRKEDIFYGLNREILF